MIKEEYQDIAPYSDSEFKQRMAQMVDDPGLEHAVRYVMPDVDYPKFTDGLRNLSTAHEFQHGVMLPFIEMLAKRTTKGISSSGIDNIDDNETYTFITNHRDIVLDASFLNLCFVRGNKPTSEIAIGNNLLIYDWITHLVKLNQSFIVKRNLKITQALEAARQLSGYIHYCLNEKRRSVWIAQREGRAKDSNDLTQESLVKMISLSGGGSTLENLKTARLLPVSISYEYDPNDYLKAREFLLKRNDPSFKKSQRDDLFSMETGLLGYKGRIHFAAGRCINPGLEKVSNEADRTEVVKAACRLIDDTIHSGYMIFPINYIAHDKLAGDNRFADHYTADELKDVNEYIDSQLAKVEIADLTTDDKEYMSRMMLQMYANPLINKLKADGNDVSQL